MTRRFQRDSINETLRKKAEERKKLQEFANKIDPAKVPRTIKCYPFAVFAGGE